MNRNLNSCLHSKRSVAAIAFTFVVFLTSLVAAQQSPKQPEHPAQSETAPKPPVRIPDTFTNLQVLPKDISKSDLVRIMKSFCITFEKRCSFCHVATDDLSQADFASDEKDTKKKARDLLRFIQEAQKRPAATP